MREYTIFIFMLLFTVSASAQMDVDTSTVELESVVVQANRLQLPASENSRTINIITRQQIQNAPVNSIAEVLQYIGGVDIRQRGVHGVQADVSIRGGTFDQVLVLINGVKMSDPQTGHHMMNIPIDMDNIERIEVLKGPAARIFGANAFSGAINIVTKVPDEASAQIHLEGGENSLGGVTASVAFPTDNFNQYFSFGKQFSDGYRFNTDYEISNYLYQSEYKLSANQKIEILGTFSDRKFGANRFYGNNSDAFANQYEEVQTSLFNVGYKKVGSKYSINTRFNWRRNQDEYHFIRSNPSIFRNFHVSNVLGLESHADFYSKAGTTGVGVEFQSIYLRSNNLGKQDRRIGTLFLEHRANFLNNQLDITPGLAVSYYSDLGTQIFPGIDVGYKIKNGLKIFANAGYTWRVPTFTDLFYEDSANLGNPNLEPESALSYEAGVKYDNKGVRANLSWFIRDGNDLIDWTRAADTLKWQPSNIANLTMSGVDASIDINSGFFGGDNFIKNLHLGYTYIDAEVPVVETGISRYVLENINHQFIAGLDHKIFGNLIHSFRFRYVDRVSMDDYSVLDLKLSWKAKKYSIYIAANNILDTEYFETNLVELPGTWIFGGVKFRFTK